MNKEDIAKINLLFDILKRRINPSLTNKIYQEWSRWDNKQKKKYPFKDYIIDKIQDDILKIIQKKGELTK